MTDIELHLLPRPRSVVRRPGSFRWRAPLAAEAITPTFAVASNLVWPVTIVGEAGQAVRVVRDTAGLGTQGYRLSIGADEVAIAASDAVGAVYGARTLQQLARQFPQSLPCVEIIDWPDFPTRGVMLDVSRDKVPTMATLLALIDRLADWKINQLQLYTEHTFAYSGHRDVWEHASPLTAAEVRELDAYCRARLIDLVPNQNSFGHMERWLKHERYAPLAEAIDGAETPWGFRWRGPFSLCPTDPASLAFLNGLYAELLPNFGSKLFNVGCDETFDVGQGRSKAACDARGKVRVYLEFLHGVNALVRRHGKRMLLWGDIILHRPDLIPELPPNVIALEWGYEANHPFDTEGEQLARAGVPYYVCPGTSSWNSLAGRTDNAIANLRAAAESGLKHGAIGYLITDWGDNGHLQYLPASYLGFVAGAAYGWCLASNRDLDLVVALDRFAFDDAAAGLGRAAYELGNVYQACGKPNFNGSALFRLLVQPPNDEHPEQGLTRDGLQAADDAITSAIASLAVGATDESRLCAAEFRNTAAMLRHCVELGRAKLNLPPGDAVDIPGTVAEHRRLWLARNRPGGLDDSVRRLSGAQR